MIRTNYGLSGNALKLIAAAAMVADHVGYLFFPKVAALRIIGRLAFPIFAYMIAEGCAYTRNKLRYFLHVFVLAVICQAVYFVAAGDTHMNILVTFSLSILLIYAMEAVKTANSSGKRIAAAAMFAAAVGAVYLLTRFVSVDYGFWGVMTPVLAGVFRGKTEKRYISVLMLGAGLLLVAGYLGGVQIYSLFSLPLLLLYSGKRGKWKMKYFYYIFYPGHLALLYLIDMLTA